MYQEKIGESLLRMEEIYPHQIENILLRQQCGDKRRFGEIAVDLRYIDSKTLESCLSASSLALWTKQENRQRQTSSASGSSAAVSDES
ncbi:hypothetical protein [Marispirochaeta sp.]|jgi:hypothetical protein|uniref:hypothetical protein n=1 Tax=Marispirochaeta sp. TaxID=2038653 RepID=UPI0029C8FF5C|nr:hypothetical protein [Marispirochaeta sp.]